MATSDQLSELLLLAQPARLAIKANKRMNRFGSINNPVITELPSGFLSDQQKG